MLKKLQHSRAKKLRFMVSKWLADWQCAKSMVSFVTPRISMIALKSLQFKKDVEGFVINKILTSRCVKLVESCFFEVFIAMKVN